MNKTKIEWADYTWNPVVGCKRGCYYCYARKMNNRFKWVDDFKELRFFSKRLFENFPKKPSKIFVGSMSDICYWDFLWLNIVFSVCNYYKKHTFLFLTKNPRIYYEPKVKFPSNCCLGFTVTGKEHLGITAGMFDYFNKSIPHKTFLSIEPLLGDMPLDLTGFDQIIVGAMTGPGAVKPEKSWIESIKHPNIFYKDNIKKYL